MRCIRLRHAVPVHGWTSCQGMLVSRAWITGRQQSEAFPLGCRMLWCRQAARRRKRAQAQAGQRRPAQNAWAWLALLIRCASPACQEAGIRVQGSPVQAE